MDVLSTIKKIDLLDLSLVKIKLSMSNEEGGYEWPLDAIDEAIVAYRTFLKTVLKKREAKSDKLLQPEPIADIVWHTHILFTQKYHEDCMDIFGEYIHHQPKIIS
ncbi:glycine-rich domain-containing protein [Legionella massiliensis]|uniref:glycine-rich domain-containing protein n=1 Tax=Legionella massiliensis TaxID=1034943 RepID=UPI00159ED1F0|nr:glycine-rich domain-containing protein-like [Legionella massiliensis]